MWIGLGVVLGIGTARAQGPWIPTHLGTLGGTENRAWAVNDAGQVWGPWH